MTSNNPYANKAYLNAAMSTLLSYSFTQTAFTASLNAASSGNTITLTSTTNLNIGSYLTISGYTSVGVLAVNTGTNVITVDISQSIPENTGVSQSAYTITPQNALQQFTTTVDAPTYYKFVASFTAALNASNTLLSLSNSKNAINGLATIDDGSVCFDSTKALQTTAGIITNLTSSNRGNTFINYSKKISLVSPLWSSTNSASFTDSASNIVTYVIGTAGGNNINENHHTRPELLSALFKDSGVGFSKRYSTTSSANLYYMAQRIGIASEENQGAIRISVPVLLNT
jgi:hypothetical protein